VASCSAFLVSALPLAVRGGGRSDGSEKDSLELGLERFPEVHADVVAMEARAPNVEGEGAISVADLVRAALRMSPDRVIVGEVRGHEVIPMLNAMTQGNDGSMCTIHANSSAGAFGRLATYAIQAPERLPLEATNLLVAGAVDVVVHLSLDRRTGRRQLTSIREVTGADGPLLLSNELFRPGADGLGVAAVPPREATLERLAAAGFDPAWLDGSLVGWRP
jgi:pilus assembly protein CpaF